MKFILLIYTAILRKKKMHPMEVKMKMFLILCRVLQFLFLLEKILNTKKTLGTVYHLDYYGTRENKFKELLKSKINNIKWKKLNYKNHTISLFQKILAQMRV